MTTRFPGAVEEDAYRCVVHVDPEAIGRGPGADGPLGGRLVVVKDNIAVRGAPWACGSATRSGLPAGRP